MNYVRESKDTDDSPSFMADVDEDDLLGTVFQMKDDDGKYQRAVVSKKISPQAYEVEFDGMTMTMSEANILKDRDFVEKILEHKGWQVCVKWSARDEPSWESLSWLRTQIPAQLADYACEHNLVESKGWKWAGSYVAESEIMEIVGHKFEGAKATVEVRWDDGVTEWMSLGELKEDAKDLLARYCNEKGLEDKKGWEWVAQYWNETKSHWFDRVRDVIANARMLREHDRLTTSLHSVYKKCCKDNDIESMVAFGRAFKESIDMRKHGGKVHLRIDLHGRIKEKALKKYLSA